MTTRTKIGVIGVVLLVMGCYLRWVPHEFLSNTDAMESAGLRVGLVMVVLWIAYPELIKLPTWMSVVTLLATPIMAWRPRAALFILPILFIAWLLSPRAKKKPNGD